jgi:hypothetical protein
MNMSRFKPDDTAKRLILDELYTTCLIRAAVARGVLIETQMNRFEHTHFDNVENVLKLMWPSPFCRLPDRDIHHERRSADIQRIGYAIRLASGASARAACAHCCAPANQP